MAGLRERWTLFVGALLSVTLGVALVQSSLLLLITAATLDPPAGLSAAERMEFADGTTASVAMLGVVLGSAVFLAAFIISSTFAFTVDQRRRDLALLRLVGGSRGQVRRVLLAAGPGGDVPTSGTVKLQLPESDLGDLPVVASVPSAMSGGANLLLPPGLVPAAQLAEAGTRSFVSPAPGADPAAVRVGLARVGQVSDLDDWLRADAAARNTTRDRIMLIVLGIGALYALIGVINAVVIGAATRRRAGAGCSGRLRRARRDPGHDLGRDRHRDPRPALDADRRSRGGRDGRHRPDHPDHLVVGHPPGPGDPAGRPRVIVTAGKTWL